MHQDLLRSFADRLAERAARPFGDVELISGRTLQPFSLAGQKAATNLLNKACRALDDDPARARELVDRAVGLPYDDHERVAPAAIGAHLELYCLVADTLEESDAECSRWLDAAAEVLAEADESARCEMRDVLVAIDQDYLLRSSEHSRIQALVAAIPDRAPLRDLELDERGLGDHVMSTLVACGRYRAALEQPSA